MGLMDDEAGDLEHDATTNQPDLTHLDKDAKTRLRQVVSRTSAEEIRHVRDQLGVGMLEAKRIVRKREIDTRLQDLRRRRIPPAMTDIVVELIDILSEMNR